MSPSSSGNGYWGRILTVDLTTNRVRYENPPEEWYRKYLGGMGISARYLWEHLKPGVDPLGPENVLGFTTGVLTDTGTVFTGRFLVVGKSPASGGWNDANCGGYFAPSLKRCGLDGLFVTGKSDRPVYLYIHNEGAEIRDASDLWGMDTIETETLLRRRHGKKAQVACIGPAGEKLSLLAGVCTDGGRIAARGGLGAVMGSKGLKAVVAAGTTRVAVADRERIDELRREFLARLEGKEGYKRFLGDRAFGLLGWIARKGSIRPRSPADIMRLMLSRFGTPSFTVMSGESGDSPVKNWAGTGYHDFPMSRSKKIGADQVLRYQVKRYGCYSCPVRCGGILKVEAGPHSIEEMHKPEYETLCAFGALLLNDDLQSIFRINDMVNRAGIDSISCGATVAFAVECFENGILSEKDTGGLPLHWGDSAAIVQLTGMIIGREGLGDVLADGVKKAAERIGGGAERFAVHCGGIEPPMHDPKFDPGFGMAYMCEPAPARHMVSSLQLLELENLERQFTRATRLKSFSTHRERHRYDDKGEAMAVGTFYRMLVDCAGACVFGTQVGGDIPLCGWLNAATGWSLSNDDYLVVGERVEQLRHAFNVREGINAIRDSRPHARIIGDPPLTRGPAKGVTLDMDALGNSFYQALGWDPETGTPSLERLQKLGMDEVIRVFHHGTGEDQP